MPFISPDHGTIPGCLRIASNQAAPAGQAEGTERSAWVTFFLKTHQRRLWKGVTPSLTLPHAPSSPASCHGEHKRSSQNQSIRAQALFAKASLVRREAVRVTFFSVGRWDAHKSFRGWFTHDSCVSNLGLHLWPRRKHKAQFLFFCLCCLPHGSHRLPDTVQSPWGCRGHLPTGPASP